MNSELQSAVMAREIDMRVIGKYMHRHWWIVPAVMVVVLGLVVMLSWGVQERFEADALVRLAKIGSSKDDVGVQGMVVKRLHAELSSDLGVDFYPRATGMVMLVGQANDLETAIRNVRLAAERLVQESNTEVVDVHKEYESRIAILEQHLELLNQQLAAQRIVAADQGVDGKNLIQSEILIQNAVKRLEARAALEQRILDMKLEMTKILRPAELISPPAGGGRPFRPHWTRNIILGLAFGFVFGLFVAFLFGMFDQLVRQPHSNQA